MGIIRIHERSGKQKRKPGWAQKQAEYDAWLKSMQTMPSGIVRRTSVATVKPQSAPPRVLTNATEGIHPVHPAKYVLCGGTKAVARPEIQYADNPEMLARRAAQKWIKVARGLVRAA
jgi:hypothetical protein